MTSDELSRAWGPTVVVAGGTGQAYAVQAFRSSQGVEMGDLVDHVRAVYRDPERDNSVFFFYFAESIAFGRDCPQKNGHDPRRVSCVLIFQKAPGFGPASVVHPLAGLRRLTN
jgi:hypothetical protein